MHVFPWRFSPENSEYTHYYTNTPSRIKRTEPNEIQGKEYNLMRLF
jgi:hypothetical protein